MESFQLDIRKRNTFLSYYPAWQSMNLLLIIREWNNDALLKEFNNFVLFDYYIIILSEWSFWALSFFPTVFPLFEQSSKTISVDNSPNMLFLTWRQSRLVRFEESLDNASSIPARSQLCMNFILSRVTTMRAHTEQIAHLPRPDGSNGGEENDSPT
jgi:hypothetical protein